jgi:hypothetical protein
MKNAEKRAIPAPKATVLRESVVLAFQFMIYLHSNNA